MPHPKAPLIARNHLLPFALITALFFLWGLARSILDVLNKHFQETIDISRTESSLIQAAVYLAYALVAVPAGLFIARRGYRSGVVIGLLLFALGAVLFIPGEQHNAFVLFLFALFVLGCGLAFLETAANPYSATLGHPATSASRLNLSQSFNGLGCILGPSIGSWMLFGEKASLSLLYGGMGVLVLLICGIFLRFPLPEITEQEASPAEQYPTLFSVWQHRPFVLGFIALFAYEIAEISINSLFVNYATEVHGMSKATAATWLSFGGLTLFMLSRVLGSWMMTRWSSAAYLALCSLGATLSSLGVMLTQGRTALGALIAVYAFEAITFPTVFATSLHGLSPQQQKQASSFMMMTPIGGAIGTFLMAFVADHSANLSVAFIVPTMGFSVVLIYAITLWRSTRSQH